MSAIVKEQTMSSMSPNNKRRPLSIIEENEDDGAESFGSEHAEKENDEQEIQKEANGHVSEEPTEEVVKSPSFRAIKQFFIDKTESHNNTKNKSAPEEKGPKVKEVKVRKKSGTDVVAPSAHKQLTKTKSPDSPKPTPKATTTSSTQHHHNATTSSTQHHHNATTSSTQHHHNATTSSTQHHHNATTSSTQHHHNATTSSTQHHHNATTSSTQHHHNTSSKPTLFSRTSARIAAKAHPATKATTTTTTHITSSKKSESNHHPSSSSSSSSSVSSASSASSSLTSSSSSSSPSSTTTKTTATTKPSARPRSSVTAPTAATQAREQAVRKSSSFGAIDRLRSKTSSPVPTKVTKSNSVGKSAPKKTVTKRNSTGSADNKERKTTKKSDPKQKDKPLDRSFTDSPMSQVSETDSVASSSNSVDNAIPIENQVSEKSNHVPMSFDHSSPDTIVEQDEPALPQQLPNPSKTSDNCSSDVQALPISSQPTPIPQCDSDPSLTSDPSEKSLDEHSKTIKTQEVPANVKTPSTTPPGSPSQNGKNKNISDSPESEEKCNNNNNNTQNLNLSNTIGRVEDLLKVPLSITLSSSPPTTLVPVSPSSLSPSLSHKLSPRSPKIMPKFRTSPTLSRRFSIERNNNKTTSLNGKLASLPLISASNTFPRSMSREGSLTDFASMDDSKDYGYILDKSRLAVAVPGSPLIANIYRSARRGSYFFKRKQSNESLNSLSESEILDNTCDDVSPISAADLNKLKETADRLHLTTRRASILSWRQTYVDGPGLPRVPPDLNGGDAKDENLTVERKQKINEALDWLRTELHDMRTQDQALARQLLTIRQDIHQLKLQRCTEEHQDLLDDFKSELETLEEFSDVLDLPHPIYEDNPLKHIGVTRHNMSARRFSAC